MGLPGHLRDKGKTDMDRLNEAQLAALDDEQRDILDFAQRQQLRTHPATAITDLNHQVVRAFTALADARLEVARLRRECDVHHAEVLRDLSAEVARLTEDKHDALVALAVASDVAHETGEERDRYRGLLNFPDAVLEIIRTTPDYAYIAWNAASQHTLDTMCKAHAEAKMEARNARQERDQQREDIRRLVAELNRLAVSESLEALLAEMKERYDA